MATVSASPEGTVVSLGEGEADMLRGLLDQMRELIESEAAVDDAVIDRLFPAAYADPKDAKAFSELVGDELRAGKLQTIGVVSEALGSSGPAHAVVRELDPWLTVLTDLRLALGTRLEVTEEKMSEQLDPNDPDVAGMAMLHWLGWLQGSLIDPDYEEETDDG